nr:hypothetical protein [Burkholderia sp. MS455]
MLELQGHGGPIVMQTAAAALPGCGARLRAAARGAGRVHAARVPERQARPRAGRGGCRLDRGKHRGRRALGRAFARWRVLAADPCARRRRDHAADAG